MRTCDVVFAVPPILSAMMLGSLLGPGRTTAHRGDRGLHRPGLRPRRPGGGSAGLVARFHPRARGAGKGATRIAWEHVLPNIGSQIAIQTTLQLGLAILTEAGLSYLGLGAPPRPSWGRMLADAQTYLARRPGW